MKDLVVGLGIISAFAGGVLAILVLANLVINHPWLGWLGVILITLIAAKNIGRLKREGKI